MPRYFSGSRNAAATAQQEPGTQNNGHCRIRVSVRGRVSESRPQAGARPGGPPDWVGNGVICYERRGVKSFPWPFSHKILLSLRPGVRTDGPWCSVRVQPLDGDVAADGQGKCEDAVGSRPVAGHELVGEMVEVSVTGHGPPAASWPPRRLFYGFLERGLRGHKPAYPQTRPDKATHGQPTGALSAPPSWNID